MVAYIARRLGSTVVVMAIVGVFVFLLLHLSPGDPAAIIAGDNASPEQIAGIRRRLGLDDPLPVQFLRWSGAVLQGVHQVLAEREHLAAWPRPAPQSP